VKGCGECGNKNPTGNALSPKREKPLKPAQALKSKRRRRECDLVQKGRKRTHLKTDGSSTAAGGRMPKKRPTWSRTIKGGRASTTYIHNASQKKTKSTWGV